MLNTTRRLVADINPMAEHSLLDAAQLARWRGLPVGWVKATPELIGRRSDDDDELVLAMLDTGQAQADIRFGNRGSRHDLSADDIALFAPRSHADTWQCRSEGVQRIMVRIRRQDLEQDTLAEGLFDAPPRTTVAFRDPALAAVLRAMTAEIAAGSPHGALYAESLSLGVAMQLRRRSSGRALHERGRLQAAQLDRLKELVRERVAQGVTISDMAQVVGLSRAHFVRQFKACAGCTPYQYVLGMRLRMAHERVLQGHMPLAEVAQSVGFSSQSHMTALFQRTYGQSPGELRRSNATPVTVQAEID